MAGRVAMVVYDKCQVENCDNGICAAVAACPRKLLIQQEPYEAPISRQSICRACSKCVKACPFGAIKMVNI